MNKNTDDDANLIEQNKININKIIQDRHSTSRKCSLGVSFGAQSSYRHLRQTESLLEVKGVRCIEHTYTYINTNTRKQTQKAQNIQI